MRVEIHRAKSTRLRPGLAGYGSVPTVVVKVAVGVKAGGAIVLVGGAMVGDSVPSNNVIEDTVAIAVHDAACFAVVAPTGVVDSGTAVTPQAWIHNLGSVPETFNCSLCT